MSKLASIADQILKAAGGLSNKDKQRLEGLIDDFVVKALNVIDHNDEYHVDIDALNSAILEAFNTHVGAE